MSGEARSGIWVAALAGFGAGLAGGLFGVGGGIVMVPVLTAFFGLTQHQAHGTSLAAVAATALAGIVVYGLAGHVAWLPAALMAVSGALTARLGAPTNATRFADAVRLIQKVPPATTTSATTTSAQ